MESAPTHICPVCLSDAWRPLVAAGVLPEGHPVFRCTRCGAAFFAERDIEPDYWSATGQEASYADAVIEEAFRRVHCRALGELVNARGDTGRLLDVGCGDGLFLSLAREQGWQAEGLDASPRAAELARARSGCPVHCGLADTLPADAGPWDAMTLWDILEHCPEPLQTLESLVPRLAPGGILAIRTPNENSFFRRFARVASAASLGLFGGFLKYVYYHPHYVTFAASSLKRLFAACGLETLSLRFEETPRAFAEAKIRAAYSRYPGHRLLCAGLPVAFALGRLAGPNKLFALARRPKNGPSTRGTRAPGADAG